MNNDKVRAEFEEWAVHQGYDLTRDEVVVAYASEETDRAWSAWQASRAALVVELPEQSPETPFSRHMVMDSSSVIEAIESAGVRVKP